MTQLHVGIDQNAKVTIDVADETRIRQSVLVRRVLDERSDPSGPVPVALPPDAFNAWLAGVKGAEDRYLRYLFGSIEVRSSLVLEDAPRTWSNSDRAQLRWSSRVSTSSARCGLFAQTLLFRHHRHCA